jgi:fructose-1,6-bisphosphatase II
MATTEERAAEPTVTAALECLGAEIQARMEPRDEADREKMADFGMDRPERVLTTHDLAPSPLYVIATGVTDGGLLKGVSYFGDGARTHSIVMDLEASTVRFIDTVHLLRPTIIREIRLERVREEEP